jgi:hypothetical protein
VACGVAVALKDGLEGFARDMHGYYRNMGRLDVSADEISWRIAADFLLAASVY